MSGVKDEGQAKGKNVDRAQEERLVAEEAS